MDRVAQRYADPFAFLGSYMQAGRFADCVENIVQALNHDVEERQEEKLWELWLHKYQGKQSFGDWKKSIRQKSAPEEKPKLKKVEPGLMTRNLDIAARTLTKLRRSNERKGGA